MGPPISTATCVRGPPGRSCFAYSSLSADCLRAGAVPSVIDVFMLSMSAAQRAAPTICVSLQETCEKEQGLTGVGVREQHGSKGDHLEDGGHETESASSISILET